MTSCFRFNASEAWQTGWLVLITIQTHTHTHPYILLSARVCSAFVCVRTPLRPQKTLTRLERSHHSCLFCRRQKVTFLIGSFREFTRQTAQIAITTLNNFRQSPPSPPDAIYVTSSSKLLKLTWKGNSKPIQSLCAPPLERKKTTERRWQEQLSNHFNLTQTQVWSLTKAPFTPEKKHPPTSHVWVQCDLHSLPSQKGPAC